MSPSQLRTAGEALYGPRWQRQLAIDLGVADRTVRRWLAGRFNIPPDLPGRIRALAQERVVRLNRIRAE